MHLAFARVCIHSLCEACFWEDNSIALTLLSHTDRPQQLVMSSCSLLRMFRLGAHVTLRSRLISMSLPSASLTSTCAVEASASELLLPWALSEPSVPLLRKACQHPAQKSAPAQLLSHILRLNMSEGGYRAVRRLDQIAGEMSLKPQPWLLELPARWVRCFGQKA